MANYQLAQLTHDSYVCDVSFPLNIRPGMSADGQRVIYTSKLEPGRPGYAIWLYEQGEDPRQLTVNTRGREHPLFALTLRPQISANGRYIVFRAPYYYTEENESGIYLYDIDSGEIRLLIKDQIPRYPNGVERRGEPGLRKYETSRPSISADGNLLSYIWTDYEYNGATRDRWIPTRQRLMLADISGSQVRGDSLLEILSENAFGHGFKGLCISADGSTIAFYAGGLVEGWAVENLDMPEFEMVRHDEYSGYTCNVYCYVLRIQGHRIASLRAVPDPEEPSTPIIVAHPQSHNVQSFRSSNIIDNPPSLNQNGRRLALNAGFVMRAANTGIYVFEDSGNTHQIISFDEVPGESPDEPILTTGAMPALSPDGRWLAYYLRSVSFREGYGNPDEYEEGETYCPCVESDDVVVCRIPSGTCSRVLGSGSEMTQLTPTPAMGVALSEDANHLALISRANIAAGNPDLSHEVFYASLIPE